MPPYVYTSLKKALEVSCGYEAADMTLRQVTSVQISSVSGASPLTSRLQPTTFRHRQITLPAVLTATDSAGGPSVVDTTPLFAVSHFLLCAQVKSSIPAPRARLQLIAVDGPNHRNGVDIMGQLSTTRHVLRTDTTKTRTREKEDENHALPPEGNGQVEQTNRTIKNLLSTFVDRGYPDAWDENLSHCLLAYRSVVHDSTGFSSALLQLGHKLRLPADIRFSLIPAEAISMEEYTRALKERPVVAYRIAADNIQAAQQHQKAYYDRHTAGTEYRVGASVLLLRPRPPIGAAVKFHQPRQGLYIIVHQPSPTRSCFAANKHPPPMSSL
ncbi:hypothetical protein SprV_0401536500 [Sparganum proliferum]